MLYSVVVGWKDLKFRRCTFLVAFVSLCETVSEISQLLVDEFRRRLLGRCRAMERSTRRPLEATRIVLRMLRMNFDPCRRIIGSLCVRSYASRAHLRVNYCKYN